MELIMAQKLIVKKEWLDSAVDFDLYGSSRRVVLKDASQEELKLVQLAGVDVFEKASDKEK